MKPLLIFLLLSCCTARAFSQSDLLVLKEHNRTIQTWIPGSVINFQFSSKQWIQGLIKNIHNDSILIEQIAFVQVVNQFGFQTTDTSRRGLMRLHVNEIYGMPKNNFGSGIISNGALFQLGGAAYILLNLINTAIHNEALFRATNVTGLGVAGGVFLFGTLLSSTHKTYITLGKKYTMETIHVSEGGK